MAEPLAPNVSAIVTCYNSAATVVRAIESIRAQTMADLEIIVVDDASTDNTIDLVAAVRDPRIRIIRNPQNRGIGGAKNVGVTAARGRYIAFLDSDDTWIADKLATQRDALNRASGVSLCFSGFWVHRIDSGKTVVRRPGRHQTWLKSILLGETFSLGSTLFATRECFDAVGPFDESLRRLQDRDWTLRYLQRWDELIFLPAPLAHIYNSGWPRPETVERSVNDLYEIHESRLRARDPALASLFRASLNFEIAVAEYRCGRTPAAMGRVFRALASHPPYAGYLASRFTRKIAERDFS